MSDSESMTPRCPCDCRPNFTPCREPLAGIEITWGECILCHQGEHWQEGDDDPAFNWPQIFADAERFSEATAPSSAPGVP